MSKTTMSNPPVARNIPAVHYRGNPGSSPQLFHQSGVTQTDRGLCDAKHIADLCERQAVGIVHLQQASVVGLHVKEKVSQQVSHAHPFFPVLPVRIDRFVDRPGVLIGTPAHVALWRATKGSALNHMVAAHLINGQVHRLVPGERAKRQATVRLP